MQKAPVDAKIYGMVQRCSPCLCAVRGLGGNFADLEGRRVGRKDVMARVDPLGRRKRLKLDRSNKTARAISY
jgi:hypothetical protein